METLRIHVTKSYPTNFEPIVETIIKDFTGKTKDKDSFDYLNKLHQDKMNQICINAGIGSYTLGRLVKRDSSEPAGSGYTANKNYSQAEKELTYSLSIKIEHIN